MARKAVIDALNSSLGRYVVEGDLDVSSLPTSLWSGSIEITKEIRLNVDAINRDYFPPDEAATAAASASAAAASAYAEDADFSKESISNAVRAPEISGDPSISQDHRSDATTATGESSDNNPARRPHPFNRQRHRRRKNTWTSPRRSLHEDWAINVNCPDRTQNQNILTLTDLSRTLQLVSGSISSIRIDIPWAALASRPVVVKVSGVKLVFSPATKPSPSKDRASSTARTHHNREDRSLGNSEDLALSRHGTSSLDSPLGISIHKPEVGSHRKSRSSESIGLLDPDDKNVSNKRKPGKNRRWGFNQERNSGSLNSMDGRKKDFRLSIGSDRRLGMENSEFDAQSRGRGSGIGGDIRTLGSKLKRALPLSQRVQREFLKSKRNREETLVRDRRRKVMAIRDDRRRRHEALRRCILSSHRESGDPYSDRVCEGSMSEGGYPTAKATPRASLSCTSTFGLDDQRRPQGSEPRKHRHRRGSISKPKTFRERLTRRLLENLQLEVANVRIELVDEEGAHSGRSSNKRDVPDSVTDSFDKEAFVLGIVMDSLVLNTTDEHGRRIYVDRGGDPDATFLYKALRISGFGIYLEEWDEYINNRPADNPTGDSASAVSTDSGSQGGNTAITEGFSDDMSIASALTNNMLSDCTRRRYVLNPISFEAAYRQREDAAFRLSPPGSNSFVDTPKYLLFCQMPHLWLAVSQGQLQLTNSLVEAVSYCGPTSAWRRARTNILYPEYRPSCSLTAATAKEWWRYAVRAVGRMTRKTCWKELWLAFRHANRYIRLYRRYCVQETMSDEQKKWWRLGRKNDVASAIFFGGIKEDGVTLDWLEPLTADEIKEMEAIEDDRSISIEGIMRWRSAAERYVNKEWVRRQHEKQKANRENASIALLKRTTSSGNLETLDLGDGDDETASNPSEIIGNRRRANSGGAVKTLFGKEDLSPDNDSQDDGDDNETLAMTQEEIDDLKMELDSVPFSSLPLNSKLAEIEFSLGFVVLDVYWADLTPLSKLRVGTTEAKYSTSVGTSHSCAFSISSVQLEDTTTMNPLFPFIIRSVHPDEQDEGFVHDENSHIYDQGVAGDPAINFGLHRQKYDQTELVLRVVPIEVVASLPFISNVAEFFSRSAGRTDRTTTMRLEEWQCDGSRPLGAGMLRFLNGKMKSAIKDVSTKTKDWIFDIDAVAPMLVLPIEAEDKWAQCVVISCGHHRLVSSDDPVRSSTAQQMWINAQNKVTRSDDSSSSNGLQSSSIDNDSHNNNNNDDDCTPSPIVRKCVLQSRAMCVMMGTSLTTEILACSGVGNLETLYAVNEEERPVALVESMGCSMEVGSIQNARADRNDETVISWIDFAIPNVAIHVTSTQMGYIAPAWRKTSKQVAQFWNASAVNVPQGMGPIPCDGSNSTSQQLELNRDISSKSQSMIDTSLQGESGNNSPEETRRAVHWVGEIENMSVAFATSPTHSFEATARSLVVETERKLQGRLAQISFGGFCLVDHFDKAFSPRTLLALESCQPGDNGDTHEKVSAAKLTASMPAPKKALDSTEVGFILKVMLEVQRFVVEWHSDSIAELMACYEKIIVPRAPEEAVDLHETDEMKSGPGDLDDEGFDDDSLLSPNFQKPTFIQLRQRQWGSAVFPSLDYLQNAVFHRSPCNETNFVFEFAEVAVSIHQCRQDVEFPDGIFAVALRNNSLAVSLSGESDEEMNLKVDSLQLSFLCRDIAPMNQMLFDDASNEHVLTLRHSKRKSRVGADHNDTRCSGFTNIKVAAPQVIYHPTAKTSIEEFFETSGFRNVLVWTADTAIDIARELVGYHTMDQVVDISFTDFSCRIPVDPLGTNSLAFRSGETIVRIGSAPFGGGGKGNVEIRELMLQFTDRRKILEEPIEIGFDIQFCGFVDNGEDPPALKFGVSTPSIKWLLSTRCFADARNIVLSITEQTRRRSRQGEAQNSTSSDSIENSFCHDSELVLKQTRIDLKVNVTLASLVLFRDGAFHPSLRLVASENSVEVVNLEGLRCSTFDISLSRLALEFFDRTPGIEDFPLAQLGTDGREPSQPINFHFDRGGLEGTTLSFFVPKAAVNVSERLEELLVVNIVRIREELASSSREEAAECEKITTRTGRNTHTINGEVKKLELAFIDREDQGSLVMLSGKYGLNWQSTGDEADGGKAYSCELQAQDVAIHRTDRNDDLGIQVMAPTSFSVVSDANSTSTGTSMALKIAALTDIDVDLSVSDSHVLTRATARVLSIFKAGMNSVPNSDCCSMESLVKRRALRQVEHLGEHGDMCERQNLVDDDPSSADSRDFHVNCVLPRMRLTLIDDFGEVLRPLFRLISENSLLQGTSKGEMTPVEEFEREARFSVAAQVYSPHSRRWEALMSQWDGTLVSSCSPIVSGRMAGRVYYKVDVNACPLQVLLSETVLKNVQYLHTMAQKICLGRSTNQATVNGEKASGTERKQLTDLAASKSGKTRYGIRNYSGVDLEYFLIGDIDYQLCRIGETKMMDFDDNAFAAKMLKRSFGQDLPSPKTIIVRMADGTLREKFPGVIIIRNMEEEIGNTFRRHSLDDGKSIYSKVVVVGNKVILNIQSWLVVHNYTELQPSLHSDQFSSRTPLLCCTNAESRHDRSTFACAVSGMSKDQNSVSKASESRVVVSIKGRGDQLYQGVITPFKDEIAMTSTLGFCKVRGSKEGGITEEFALSITIDKVMVDGYVAAELSLRPMAVIKNLLPVVVSIRTSHPNALRLPVTEEKRVACGDEHAVSYSRTTTLELAVGAESQKVISANFCLQMVDGAKSVGSRYHCDRGIFLELIEPPELDSSGNKLGPETRIFAIRARTTIVDHTKGYLAIDINDEQDAPLIAVESSGTRTILVPYGHGKDDDGMTVHVSSPKEVRAKALLRFKDVVRARDVIGSKPLLRSDGEHSGIYAYKTFRSCTGSQEVHLVSAFEFFNNTQLPLTISYVGNPARSAFPVDPGTSSLSFDEAMNQKGITISFKQDTSEYVSDAVFPFDIGIHDIGFKCSSLDASLTLTLEVCLGGLQGRTYIVIRNKKSSRSFRIRSEFRVPSVRRVRVKLRQLVVVVKPKNANTKGMIMATIDSAETSFWSVMEMTSDPDSKEQSSWKEWFELRGTVAGVRISDCVDGTEGKLRLGLLPTEDMGLLVRGQGSALTPGVTTIDSGKFTLVDPDSSVSLHIDDDILGRFVDIWAWCEETLVSISNDWASALPRLERSSARTVYKVKQLVVSPIRATALRQSKKDGHDEDKSPAPTPQTPSQNRLKSWPTGDCVVALHQLEICHWKGSLPALLRVLIAVFECRWYGVIFDSESKERSSLVLDVAATEDEAVLIGRPERTTDLSSSSASANQDEGSDQILALIVDEILNATTADDLTRTAETQDGDKRKPIANFLKRFRKQR